MMTVGGQPVEVYNGGVFQPQAVVVGSIIRWAPVMSFNAYKQADSSSFAVAVANMHNAILGGSRSSSNFTQQYTYLPFHVNLSSGRTGTSAFWFTPNLNSSRGVTDVYELRLASGYEYRSMYGSGCVGANVHVYRQLYVTPTHLNSFASGNSTGHFTFSVADNYSGYVYGQLGITSSYDSNVVLSGIDSNTGNPTSMSYDFPTSLSTGEEQVMTSKSVPIPNYIRGAGTLRLTSTQYTNKTVSNFPPLGERLTGIPYYRNSIGTVRRNHNMHDVAYNDSNSNQTNTPTQHGRITMQRNSNESWRHFRTTGSGNTGRIFGDVTLGSKSNQDPSSVLMRFDVDSVAGDFRHPVIAALPMRKNTANTSNGHVAVKVDDGGVFMYDGGFDQISNNILVSGQNRINLSSGLVNQPITIVATVYGREFVVRVYQTSTNNYLGHAVLLASYTSIPNINDRRFKIGGAAEQSEGWFGIITSSYSRKIRNIVYGDF